MQDGTFLALMRFVPKSALSRAVGTLTRLPAPAGMHQAATTRLPVRASG